MDIAHDVTGVDVLDAFSKTMDAAEKAGRSEDTLRRVRALVASENKNTGFVGRILGSQLGVD